MNMAKKAPKKSIEKKSFDLSSFKKTNGMDITVKEKDLTWIPMSDSFHEALKIPGLARGYFTSFRGYSNTGKSTAIYEAAAGAQKIGDLPVIIETESNWSWEHAKNIGVQFEEVVDEETGEIIDYEGDFIFMNSDDLLQRYKCVDYSNGKEGTKQLRGEPVIEDVARIISDLLDAQEDGDLPRNLCFLWDSVGSINGFKSVMSKSNNNQWNAGSMETAFKSLTNHRIPASRKMGKPYTNTFAVVQKIWLDNENKVIKHKGGEAFFYSPRVIVHFGGILSHSTVKLKATSGGETYQFGIETKVRCEKNQVNGIEEHGKLASTPHGYWNPAKIDQYKKEHKDYILERLNTTVDDFVIEKEEQGFGMDDLGE
tara:strand:- start:5017 stop:6123 length:1107 start_codon:yes stop_codon:yes gene_type:complete